MAQNGSMDKPDQMIEGFEVNHTAGGILTWNLSAEHANIYEQKKVARAEKPKIMFYEDKQLSSTLTSRHALLHTETSDIEAWEDVVIVSAVEKSRLETTRAYYKSDTNKIYSDEPVRFIQKESVTTGTGMESTIDLASIIIKNQKVEILKAGTKASANKARRGEQDTQSPSHQ